MIIFNDPDDYNHLIIVLLIHITICIIPGRQYHNES